MFSRSDRRHRAQTRRRRASACSSILAHVLLIGASILMLYPLLWMLSASFRPENEIFTSSSHLAERRSSLDAYIRGWNGLRVSFRHLLPQLASSSRSCASSAISPPAR